MELTKTQAAILDILRVKKGCTFATLCLKLNLALEVKLTLDAVKQELHPLEEMKLVVKKMTKDRELHYHLTWRGNKTKVRLKKSYQSQGTG